MRIVRVWFGARRAAWALAATTAFGCGSSNGDDAAPATPVAGSAKPVDLFDAPIAGIAPDLVAQFNDGDSLFGTPLRNADGLGPLYTRSSCDACHTEALRGPLGVQ